MKAGRRNKVRKVLPNGRNETSQTRFVRLPHPLLFSPAYRALSPNARSLLVELVSIYNGRNNGSIYLSVRDAAHRLGVSDTDAASNAFDELQVLGFIAMTRNSFFDVKAATASRARTWRLTWEPCDKVGATHDYTKLEPEPCTRERKRMDRGLRALKKYRKQESSGKYPMAESRISSPYLPEPGD